MKILAIDTSTKICSVALWNDNNIYTYSTNFSGKHSQHILSSVKETLNQGNITLEKLDALAFNRGPGSFTGIRIGIGVMQGLALGATLPMIGISAFAMIAQGIWRKIGATRVAIMIDAYMDKIYWAKYIRSKYGIWFGEETETILQLDTAIQQTKKLSNKWIIVKIGRQILSKIIGNNILNLIDDNISLPNAEDMLPIAYYLLSNGHGTTVEHAKPVYLHI